MVVAKIIGKADNNTFMHKVYPNLCPKCGYSTKVEINEYFRLNKRKYDVSATWDSFPIVSQKFKDFCEVEGFENIDFVSFINEPNFYSYTINKIFRLDSARRNVVFNNFCDACKRFEEIVGAVPSFIEEGFVIQENSFYRSEFEFGGFNRKFPLTIVSIDVAEKIKRQKFKGIYFKDVLL